MGKELLTEKEKKFIEGVKKTQSKFFLIMYAIFVVIVSVIIVDNMRNILPNPIKFFIPIFIVGFIAGSRLGQTLTERRFLNIIDKLMKE